MNVKEFIQQTLQDLVSRHGRDVVREAAENATGLDNLTVEEVKEELTRPGYHHVDPTGKIALLNAARNVIGKDHCTLAMAKEWVDKNFPDK